MQASGVLLWLGLILIYLLLISVSDFSVVTRVSPMSCNLLRCWIGRTLIACGRYKRLPSKNCMVDTYMVEV